MTPEERAVALVVEWVRTGPTAQGVEGMIAAALRAAVEEQREADARTVEGNALIGQAIGPLFNAGWAAALKACADIIRSGGAR